MIELLPETEGNIVALFASLSEKERMRAFVDYDGLEGFEPGVKSAGLSFELRHRALVERIAFVCAADLQDEVDRMADIFKMAAVKRFDPAQRDDAWNWLKSE